MDKKIKTLLENCAEINGAKILVQKLAPYVHHLHNPTKKYVER
jgi:hypothetical protein